MKRTGVRHAGTENSIVTPVELALGMRYRKQCETDVDTERSAARMERNDLNTAQTERIRKTKPWKRY